MTDAKALADEYEAGLKKCTASGYEEYGPDFQQRQQLIIDALRSYAALAATPAVGGEARDILKRLSGWCAIERGKLGAIDGYDYRSGEEFGLRRAEIEIEKQFRSLAAQPASPLRGMEDLAPSPCSDLSIGELIEWLDNPQWTNGYLNSDAANHMSAAAELIERLVSSAPKGEK